VALLPCFRMNRLGWERKSSGPGQCFGS